MAASPRSSMEMYFGGVTGGAAGSPFFFVHVNEYMPTHVAFLPINTVTHRCLHTQ